ncbi:hypothetical protein RRG08_052067 [Elysia crispata]|uniref:Uncharacterized protein n=1 Tax=Elysia crispata TaxID=231223 RepID=A0AAE1A5M3_9GAST|nr:hypothetical protein RRG08_052067 [Elysia crispata]
MSLVKSETENDFIVSYPEAEEGRGEEPTLGDSQQLNAPGECQVRRPIPHLARTLPAPGAEHNGSPGAEQNGSPGAEQNGSPGAEQNGSPGAEQNGSPGAEQNGSPGAEQNGSPGAEQNGSPGAEHNGSPGAEQNGSPGAEQNGCDRSSWRRREQPARDCNCCLVLSEWMWLASVCGPHRLPPFLAVWWKPGDLRGDSLSLSFA